MLYIQDPFSSLYLKNIYFKCLLYGEMPHYTLTCQEVDAKVIIVFLIWQKKSFQSHLMQNIYYYMGKCHTTLTNTILREHV